MDRKKSVAVELDSTLYIKWLMIACFFVYISIHLWLVVIFIAPLAVVLMKRLGNYSISYRISSTRIIIKKSEKKERRIIKLNKLLIK